MDEHPLAQRGLYVPLDVNYADDPKVIEAGPEAELLYVRSLAIAKRIGTDGAIHRAHITRLTFDLPSVDREGVDALELAHALVKAGLWVEVPDGWRIVAWDRWNLTSDQIAERRRGKAEGGSLGNHRRWHEARGVVDPNCSHCCSSDDRSHTDSVGGSDRESTETETETETDVGTVPPSAEPTTHERAKPRKRIPADWEPSDDDLAWCREHYPQLDPWQVAREFRTYWQGCGKPMADWSMTYRNRVQKVAGWSQQTGPTRTFL